MVILVLCSANKLRSPLFAAILRFRLGVSHVVMSAGAKTQKWGLTGQRASKEAVESVFSLTNGMVNLDNHRATPVEVFNLGGFDRIYTLSGDSHEYVKSLGVRHTHIVMEDPYDRGTHLVDLQKHQICERTVVEEVSKIVAAIEISE